MKLIDIVQRDGVLDNVNRMGAYFREGLLRLQRDFPEIGDIRQLGLHIGIEMVQDPQSKKPLIDETKALRDEAMKRGVIFGLAGVRKNLLKIKPPLIINEAEAQYALDVLSQTLKAVLR